ncbi:hypothetical protein [Marinomonas sp. IMCC 4694]|uniref:hypothetical protein n=1 Tax=Marinomonas sp. IMCC 4694 TaxID=2605432 RepID=UPI0011E7152E|nr:hypothetical protein [Marinomonas sp. IMCC 4694]TYL48766.1 hypothetical protein FXV75_13030 [Marinomonas sp. IMCC 4694]
MRDHKQLAKDAIDLVKPAIETLFNQTNRKELHIVVMDPRVKPWESTFENAILYQESIKNTLWTVPFDVIAREKAAQAWRYQRANIDYQTKHPSSLKDNDVLFYGSFVYGDIVVACSGVEQWFDMLISGWIALAFEQLAMADYQKCKALEPTKMHKK